MLEAGAGGKEKGRGRGAVEALVPDDGGGGSAVPGSFGGVMGGGGKAEFKDAVGRGGRAGGGKTGSGPSIVALRPSLRGMAGESGFIMLS